MMRYRQRSTRLSYCRLKVRFHRTRSEYRAIFTSIAADQGWIIGCENRLINRKSHSVETGLNWPRTEHGHLFDEAGVTVQCCVLYTMANCWVRPSLEIAAHGERLSSHKAIKEIPQPGLFGVLLQCKDVQRCKVEEHLRVVLGTLHLMIHTTSRISDYSWPALICRVCPSKNSFLLL
jgi:hypothetical protein